MSKTNLNKIPAIYGLNSLGVYIGGKMYNVDKTNSNFDAIKAKIASGEEEGILDLINTSKRITNYAGNNGNIVVKDGVVYANGVELSNALTTRLLELINDQYHLIPLINFIDNIQQNPDPASISELYDFLAHRGLPITEDGCFLAYKAVGLDFMDKYTSTIDNHVGKIIEIPREKVDPNRRNECSYGLHVGVMEYVMGYGGGANNAKYLLVKVNPRDAVAVPKDHNFQKLRVCRYEVLKEIPYAQEILRSATTSDGSPLPTISSKPYRPLDPDDYSSEDETYPETSYDDNDDEGDIY